MRLPTRSALAHKPVLILWTLLAVVAGSTHAALTDISPTPLVSTTNLNVLPNVLFTLDDSGSMGNWNLPDHVNDEGTCKLRADLTSRCSPGDPPSNAARFNKAYYNPGVRYVPALNADGTLMPTYGSPWTSVKEDAFTSTSSTINLTSGVAELRYCNSSGVCKRNGIDNGNPFEYRSGSNVGYPDTTYRSRSLIASPPHYYDILPKEYCSDVDLTLCVLANAPAAPYTFPAYVRYCTTRALADQSTAVSGANTCKEKFGGTFQFARYGKFSRVDILPSRTSYPKSAARTDCAGSSCTYAEEMTNFANWFAYYRTRMQMMKTAVGYAFAPIDDRFRVGLVTINPGNPVSSARYLKIDKFTPTHKQQWYAKLYSQLPSGNTPLRTALSRAGRHFAGKQDLINQGMTPDPVQYSCQQNYLLLTTDGYWNSTGGYKINGVTMGNEDRGAPRPYYDGPDTLTLGDTLADAAYYYNVTDLRPSGSIGALGLEVSENNVRPGVRDTATHQHMTTFTLGLVDGLMTWKSKYETLPGDYKKILDGSSGCSWAAGTCNWPQPISGSPATIDDLWHAAVNGRGLYFNAADATSLSDGLNAALTSIQSQDAAGAAAATSTPIITPADGKLFRTSYKTVSWTGQVQAHKIDANTGAVNDTPLWKAHELLNGRVGSSSDTRAIYTYTFSASNRLKEFRWNNLASTEQAYFSNKCVPSTNLTQCATLDSTQLAQANSGENMVNFLRGHKQYEGTVFRAREGVLGDTINATPLFVGKPRRAYADNVSPTYSDWKASAEVANRRNMLYVGSNDGMLHAFDADTGQELWAYVPRIVMPNMYKLAEENYAARHTYLVDGSPAEMDIYDGSTWRTILVSGLNSGGRGFFALDVTNPDAPKALWEFCHDVTLCTRYDPDMGLSYAKPIITKLSNGVWVVIVTSGYNNVSPGSGKGSLYVLDALSGTIKYEVSNNQGSTTSPSGLGRASAWVDTPRTDNTAKVVYAGDMEGYIWRFDLTQSTPSVSALGRATDASGKPQPITTAPELALIKNTFPTVFVGTGRYLGPTDLSDPASQSPAGTSAWQQSIYAVKDTGTALGNLRSAGLVQQTILGASASATTRSASKNSVDWNSANGWYVDLSVSPSSTTGPAQAERVTVDPILVLGTLVVVGNVPGGSMCSAGGDSWIYQFDFATGSFVNSAPGDVVATKQVGAMVAGLVVYQLQNSATKGSATRTDNQNPNFDIHIAGHGEAHRVSWKEITK